MTELDGWGDRVYFWYLCVYIGAMVGVIVKMAGLLWLALR